MKMTTKFLVVTLLLTAQLAHATNNQGRLGMGLSHQLKNNMPAISFKLQKSAAFAFGGLIGTKFGGESEGYGAGLKFYRIIFDEPQLNFYFSMMGALLSNTENGSTKSGFQVDGTFGSEFHFVGLESLGFSLEFGLSANKVDDFVLETVADHFVVAAVHFYL